MGASYFLTVHHKDLEWEGRVPYVWGIKQQRHAMKINWNQIYAIEKQMNELEQVRGLNGEVFIRANKKSVYVMMIYLGPNKECKMLRLTKHRDALPEILSNPEKAVASLIEKCVPPFCENYNTACDKVAHYARCGSCKWSQ